MNDLNQSPENEQEKLLQMMPNYASPVPPEEFRVGFGRRLGATILDYVFLTILLLIGMQITGLMDLVSSIDLSLATTAPEEFEAIMNDISLKIVPLSLAISVIYYSMEIFFAGTLGKIILGIRIGNEKREHADMKALLIRFFIKNSNLVFSLLFLLTSAQLFSTISFVFWLIIVFGFFMVLSDKRQALHDKIAHSAVYFSDEFKDSSTEQ